MIAIGSCFFPSRGDTERRQQSARDALRSLDGVVAVNLQFTDEDYRCDGLRSVRALARDSVAVTGQPGRRKPIVDDMFDALAGAAEAEGCRYFAYLNADIEVTQDAVVRIESRGADAYAFCRVDVDPGTRQHPAVQWLGVDMFAIDVRWWRRERRRFRAYIAGEPYWDNVYAAICCSHGRAEIVNDEPGILHERHATAWEGGAFADYNGYLAALDAPYFSRWAVYVSRVQERLAAGRPVDSGGIVAQVFRGPLLSPAGYARHAARTVLARLRYARARARYQRSTSS